MDTYLCAVDNLSTNMKVAVVGCTGLVGRKMLQILEERKFPVTTLIPVASERSVGKSIDFIFFFAPRDPLVGVDFFFAFFSSF